MVSVLETFTKKGSKIAVQKKVFLKPNFAFLGRILFGLVLVLVLVLIFFWIGVDGYFFLPPLPKVQYPNFLDFLNQWEKTMERSGLRLENFI